MLRLAISEFQEDPNLTKVLYSLMGMTKATLPITTSKYIKNRQIITICHLAARKYSFAVFPLWKRALLLASVCMDWT